MTAATRKQFAELMGFSPAYVTKLGKEGRLVLTADGKRVEVEASRLLISQTSGDRDDVAARHAAARAAGEKKSPDMAQGINPSEKIAQRPSVQSGGGMEAEKIGNSLQASRAVKEKYAALRARAEYEQLIGNLIPKEDVDAAMRFIGGAVRAALEVFPDQTAPLVAPITDLHEISETLQQACRDTLQNIGTAIERQKAEINKETVA